MCCRVAAQVQCQLLSERCIAAAAPPAKWSGQHSSCLTEAHSLQAWCTAHAVRAIRQNAQWDSECHAPLRCKVVDVTMRTSDTITAGIALEWPTPCRPHPSISAVSKRCCRSRCSSSASSGLCTAQHRPARRAGPQARRAFNAGPRKREPFAQPAARLRMTPEQSKSSKSMHVETQKRISRALRPYACERAAVSEACASCQPADTIQRTRPDLRACKRTEFASSAL